MALQIFVVIFILCVGHQISATQGAPDSGLVLCLPIPGCGDGIYNPFSQCCDDDTILPLNQINKCGHCMYWPCLELCCYDSLSKKFVVKLKTLGKESHCHSSPISRECPV